MPGKASHARNFPPPLKKKTHSMLPPPGDSYARLPATDYHYFPFFLGLENPLLLLLFYAKPSVAAASRKRSLLHFVECTHTEEEEEERRRIQTHALLQNLRASNIFKSFFSFEIRSCLSFTRPHACLLPSGGEREEENSRILDPYGGRWLLLDLLSTFTLLLRSRFKSI